mmetsp:Transcript_65299/g.202215  ORF Transcript_65299/g.202215 Transcript_65299/m.202215 type:complete len:212 (-) Transcript_65299:692-1327(-)
MARLRGTVQASSDWHRWPYRKGFRLAMASPISLKAASVSGNSLAVSQIVRTSNLALLILSERAVQRRIFRLQSSLSLTNFCASFALVMYSLRQPSSSSTRSSRLDSWRRRRLSVWSVSRYCSKLSSLRSICGSSCAILMTSRTRCFHASMGAGRRASARTSAPASAATAASATGQSCSSVSETNSTDSCQSLFSSLLADGSSLTPALIWTG